MATQLTTRDPSRTPHQRALTSTVARKALMAVTGLILVAFLLMHMFGNTKLLIPEIGAQEFDEYSHYLRRFLYPVLPPMLFLWLFRIALLLSAVVHIVAAVQLTFRDYDAKGGMGRYLRQRYLAGSFAARTMIWGGIIILGGVIFHLLQFTTQTITVGYTGSVDPHERVALAFQEWWMVVFYGVWMIAVCIHVWHGFYSAFCTLGARVGAFSEKVLVACSWIVALLVYFGFMVTPIAILTGLVSF
ncbi:MAG: succinate dehydrogenase cytochrome b subunit [Brooklawnia sp.]|nr:succinate dehydrogenase cytochrome b subunit [Brooklawnia sp.]